MAYIDNIIDIAEQLNKKNKPPGLKVLESMDSDMAGQIVSFILNIMMTEVSIGLGLIDIEDELDDDIDLAVYQNINRLYQEAAGHCYFCSDEHDPNETEIDSNSIFCMSCRLKLANFVQALGIDPGKIFRGMPQRKVQVSRIKRYDSA